MIADRERPSPSAQLAWIAFAVVLLDPEGRIAEANPAAEEMLGDSARRLKGRLLGEVVTIADERVADALDEGDAKLVARRLPIRIGARKLLINLSCSPIRTEEGWRVVTLSELGQEDEVGEGGDELRAPAVLAHEIKNPLSAIRGASQLLSRRVGERDGHLATLILTEVDRIANLIDRMQVLGSRTPALSASCNLHEAIRAAVSSTQASRDGHVEIREEFDPSLPEVGAERHALEQVLINLLSNACEACESDENPQVIVRTRYVSGFVFSAIRLGKSTRLPIEIAIVDNGPGVDPELVDSIFEPFVSSKLHGQGLGLALVRKMVRDMGGRITHERDDDSRQTIFRLHLPAAE